jgi:ABC-2 type transport system permease protein
VNWEHFKAFVWLRWRLLYNQARRAGALNAILTVIVVCAAILTAIPLLIGSVMLGLFAIPKAQPAYLMYAWDAVVGGFLFFWLIGLITELQRTDPLSLSKFMHLPVSANGAFLINYVSSLVRLSLIIFLPIMLGFSVALVAVKGIAMLPVLLLVAAFLLMVTALTYQFQGWLAALMSNPRRRRTVIMLATVTIVLIAQLPNLFNFMSPWGPINGAKRRAATSAAVVQELEKLNRDLQSGAIDANEAARRSNEIMERQRLAQQPGRDSLQQVERTARFVNMILPIGWLPFAVMAADEGSFVPSILGLLGMTSIGAISLYRAYRTTVGMYQGVQTSRKGRPAPAVAISAEKRKPPKNLVEANLPLVSEPVAAVALAGLRSLLRAPEAKMMLISPLVMSVIFGSMLWRSRNTMSDAFRPLVAIGGMMFVLLGVVQLMANQFGFDRDGFRVFVLSSARRRDILLGKNLSFAPLVLGMGAIVLGTLQVVSPLRWDHFLSMIPQYISMYLLFCLLMNFLSIYAPAHVAAGSLKPAQPKFLTVLLHMVTFMIFFPLTQAVTLAPLGTEFILRLLGRDAGVPICLLLSLLECALIAVIYHFCNDGLGSLLQSREHKILETVTAKAA